jgi:hypothetical protein
MTFFPPLAYAGDNSRRRFTERFPFACSKGRSANSLHIIPDFSAFVNRFLKILFGFFKQKPEAIASGLWS